MAFHPEEQTYLEELQLELRRVEEWPEDSPLAFVVHLASRTRGKLGEHLLAKIAAKLRVPNSTSHSPNFDLAISRQSGVTRVEIKLSTENAPRFQQVRDPRREGTMKYDALLCVSGRPEGLVYWLLDADEVAKLIDSGTIIRQYQDSTTNWFFPSRTSADAYSEFRKDFEQLKTWLTS